MIDHYERHEAAFLAWRASTRCIAVGATMTVSDHALLRYLERVGGFDIEALRVELAAKVQAAIDAGATSIKDDGMVFIIRNGVLVTVAPDKPRIMHSRRCRRGRGR